MPIQIFLLLVGCQIKHFLCDYPLQTPWMLKKFDKFPGYIGPLAAHCAVQMTGTLILLGAWTEFTGRYIPGNLLLCLLAFQFIAHFVMDRIKASPDLLGRYKALSAAEFMALQADPPMMLGRNSLEPKLYKITEHHAASLRKRNTYFWWALGFDQMVHHITDLIVVLILLKY